MYSLYSLLKKKFFVFSMKAILKLQPIQMPFYDMISQYKMEALTLSGQLHGKMEDHFETFSYKAQIPFWADTIKSIQFVPDTKY